MDLLDSQNDLETPVNPTTLAMEFQLRGLVGFGQGHLVSWEDFWELLEQAYWRNRCLNQQPIT